MAVGSSVTSLSLSLLFRKMGVNRYVTRGVTGIGQRDEVVKRLAQSLETLTYSIKLDCLGSICSE